MATLGLLRLAQTTHLAKSVSPLLLRHVTPLAGCMPQSKALMVTPNRQARIYGPADIGPPATGHWRLERGLSLSLIPLIPVAFMFPSQVMDYTISTAIVLHIHWSLSSVTTDYIHGEYVRPMVKPVLLVLSMTALGSLFYFNAHDVGILGAVIEFFTKVK